MSTQLESMFARQLEERKQKLQEATSKAADPAQLRALIDDVDRALSKISHGMYGLCETCHEPIERDRLAFDPLTRYCIDHLSESEQHALERDLELARQIQIRLLPNPETILPGWESAYHYEPSGQVSGDYCDIIVQSESPTPFYFIVGDVTGKGIAASMLMSQLHAMFRTLAGTGLPLDHLMGRINRLFCEASLTTHFATLVCGLARQDGVIDIANAGHCPPLVKRRGTVDAITQSGLPLGIACDTRYDAARIDLTPGDSIILYTDGLSEAADESGELYSEQRITELIGGLPGISPHELVSRCVADLDRFTGGGKRADDLTLLAIRKK